MPEVNIEDLGPLPEVNPRDETIERARRAYYELEISLRDPDGAYGLSVTEWLYLVSDQMCFAMQGCIGAERRRAHLMKSFQQKELRQAIAHAKAGCQSLHLHRVRPRTSAPQVFRSAWQNGEDLAHLFDMDLKRLRTTAKALGVNVIKVERIGTDRQHIDLCAGPLRKALERCEA